VTADERTDPRTVDGGHAFEVDDEVALAAAIQLPELTLERFGGSPGNERLLRR
jgi:hypothetical protein